MSTIAAAQISGSLPLPESAGSSRRSAGSADSQAAAKVAQDFESVFASMLLKEMRQSLQPGSLFGEDAGDIYGGLFDRFLGEQMTRGTGLGMSSMVRESIERMQRAAAGSSAPSARPDAGAGVAQAKSLPDSGNAIPAAAQGDSGTRANASTRLPSQEPGDR